MIGVKQIPIDSDTRRFIFAAGISNFAQIMSVDYIVKQFKTNFIWLKHYAVYPMMGGIAASCKLNLMNPIDSDLAYRLTFFNYPIISQRGVDWNGSNQYADTHLVPTTLSVTDSGLSYYSRENVGSVAECFIGSASNSSTKYFQIATYIDNNIYNDIGSIGAGQRAVYSYTTTAGLYSASRTSSSNFIASKNGVVKTTNTNAASGAMPSTTTYLAVNDNSDGLIYYCTQQCAFASISKGITAADEWNKYRIIQIAQTINFGRQV